MDAKAVLLFVIIPLCLLAGLVTMGIKQWKELREVDTQGGDEAAPGREATALPTRARAPAKSRRPPRLIRAGAKHESRCQWAAALEQYEESARLDDQPETRAKIRAVRYIQTALELEKENKGWDRAAGAYRLALADCANKEFVQRRINYCECIEPFTKAYEEGKALESAGQWQQSLSAYRESEGHAAKGDIESDLAERIKAVEAKLAAALAKERRLKTRMGRLLGMLVDQKKWRGALLACAFYSASPEHAEFAATIEATRVVAAKAAEADRAAHPLRAEGQTFDFLVMEDGTERRGMLLDRGDRVCKFRVMERLGEQTIMEVMKNVARIEKRQVSAKQLLHEEALTLLEQAVEALKEKRTLETAELLGRVCLDYPDVPLGKDQVLQSQVLTLNNPEIGAQIGDTLEAARVRIVPQAEERADFIEHMCLDCRGEGQVACPRCKGQGSADAVCPKCRGAKALPCPKCNGRGSRTCRKCNGAGSYYKNKRVIDRNGRRSTQRVRKTCPRTVRCVACRGDGRARCPECMGKGTAAVPCPDCKGGKKVQCQKCEGQGRLPGEDDPPRTQP